MSELGEKIEYRDIFSRMPRYRCYVSMHDIYQASKFLNSWDFHIMSYFSISMNL